MSSTTNNTHKAADLGHPCAFTKAKERFAEPASTVRGREFREVERRTGHLLMDLSDRLENGVSATRVMRDLVSSTDDDGKLKALVEMLTDYECETANLFYRLAGHVIAGFESAEGRG